MNFGISKILKPLFALFVAVFAVPVSAKAQDFVRDDVGGLKLKDLSEYNITNVIVGVTFNYIPAEKQRIQICDDRRLSEEIVYRIRRKTEGQKPYLAAMSTTQPLKCRSQGERTIQEPVPRSGEANLKLTGIVIFEGDEGPRVAMTVGISPAEGEAKYLILDHTYPVSFCEMKSRDQWVDYVKCVYEFNVDLILLNVGPRSDG